VRERARVLNRIQKVLEEANIKLGSVVSQIHGVSSQRILRAIVGGEDDPQALAALADPRLRVAPDELAEAVQGMPTAHHRFLLGELLSHLAFLDRSIATVSEHIEECMAPLEQQVALLETIPGVSRRTAEILLAEIGSDMSRFPSSAHLASWSGVCPGSNESAGKRRSGKTRKGSPWLRSALVEAAHCGRRKKESYLKAQYHRLASRRGKKRALVAVGHTILVIAYHVLSRGEPYHEMGDNYYDELAKQRVERRLVRRLEKLGFTVTLETAVAA
jgi:transposase